MKQSTSRQAIDIIKREYSEQTGLLVLSNCGLQEIPPEVFDMHWLTALTITNGENTQNEKSKIAPTPNRLSHIPERIGQLKNLKHLRIGGQQTDPWPINDIQAILQLDQLEKLFLDDNQIYGLPDLRALSKLQLIALNANHLESLDGLMHCTELKHIFCELNAISDLHFNSSNLKNLKNLYLSGNKIRGIDGLDNLPQLENLQLSENSIEDLLFLNKASNLRDLSLSSNAVNDLSPLAGLRAMRNLDLKDNQIESVEPLEVMDSLEILYIAKNNIKDISPLRKLNLLKRLFAGNNQIQEIESVTQMKGLQEISFFNNPIEDCPPDVYQTNDVQQIQAYFESQRRDNFIAPRITRDKKPKTASSEKEEATGNVEDIKLIFVGNSGAGKTQLSKYFETGKLDKTRESTHGIRLKRWLPSPKVSEAFQPLRNKIAANIWDFGGQEYYHGTFRLFLSNFAVYVLLWEQDTNENEVILTQTSEAGSEEIQHFPYEYWLDNIRHYAPTSPILLVQNKTDKDGVQRVDTQILRNYNIKNDHQISLFGAAERQAKDYEWRFHLFCDALAKAFEQVRYQELQQSQKSEAWLKIRDAVVEIAYAKRPKKNNPFLPFLKSGKFIHLEDFNKACLSIESELTQTELYTLPRWLHNSGVVIYFAENPRLQNKVYLNPTWVTEKIYRVLDKTVRDKAGFFSTTDIKASKDFPRDTILALMKEMELIFEKYEQPDQYVAPQYLPEHHPIEDLYAIAERGLQQDAFFVRLPLYFFHKVLQRLIFLYGQSPSVNARYYWKKGILFEKQGTRIIVKGMVDTEHSNCGTLLIGTEPSGNYTEIQKEVFHFITKILEDEDLISFLEPDSATDKSTATDKIYQRSLNWTARYSAGNIPRWLDKMEVSVDGQHFVHFYPLCQANKREELYIHTAEGQRLRIHDFALLVDTPPKRPLRVFFSYSHKDTAVMEELSVHLAPLKRLDKIEVWSDRAIQAGDEWDETINENLRNSDVVLFLISADFVASSYIWEKEIPLALQYQQDSFASVRRVIPIYLRPFDYSGLQFSTTEMLPKNPNNQSLEAISQWSNKDEAYMAVANALRDVIETMQ